MGVGFGAMAFTPLGRLEAQGAGTKAVVELDSLNPFKPREPHFTPCAKSVIFLFMVDQPSQLDAFDYNPELQKLNDKPVPNSIKKVVESAKFANVFHGCQDELMAAQGQNNDRLSFEVSGRQERPAGMAGPPS